MVSNFKLRFCLSSTVQVAGDTDSGLLDVLEDIFGNRCHPVRGKLRCRIFDVLMDCPIGQGVEAVVVIHDVPEICFQSLVDSLWLTIRLMVARN